MDTVKAFIATLVETRKREPGDDFIGFLLQAEIEGRKLSDVEINSMGVLLFVASLDTVAAACRRCTW
jgi:cytochrome P450